MKLNTAFPLLFLFISFAFANDFSNAVQNVSKSARELVLTIESFPLDLKDTKYRFTGLPTELKTSIASLLLSGDPSQLEATLQQLEDPVQEAIQTLGKPKKALDKLVSTLKDIRVKNQEKAKHFADAQCQWVC